MRWVEYVVFLTLVVALARPVGVYLARVFDRKPTFLDPALRPVESLLCRLWGVNPSLEMTAGVYTLCFLLFSAAGTAGLCLLLLAQRWLPGGPADPYLTTPMTVLVASLCFLPALALVPIVEALHH
jgi:K+-transporting ATPase ATPase A chain